MRTALITGGSGFIGRALSNRLVAQGWKVRVTTRKDPAKIKASAGMELVRVDYADKESLRRAVEGCDAVFHLAAAIFACSFGEFETANSTSTANLVAACAQAQKKPECFVYVSSLAAGGPSQNAARPRTEDMTPSPVSDYGKTKLGGEKALGALPPDIRRVVLRPAIVYGKNDSGISKIALWVRRGLMINMCAGEVMFSFTYIDDLVDSLVEAEKTPALSGSEYFICEEKSYPWTTFIATLATAMGKPMPRLLTLSPGPMRAAGVIYQTLASIFGFEPAFNVDKAREACAGHWTASPKKWMQATGRTTWTELDEGVRKTFASPTGK
jgi:nucleoside-diphosphate-sugar epimerase